MIVFLPIFCYDRLAMRKYVNYHVKKVVSVKNLITIEYLVLPADFHYPEECHSFYEIAFVDDGSIYATVGATTNLLKQGDFFLIPPEQPHHYSAVKGNSATLFIACFSCKSDFLDVIHGKSVADKELKRLIADVITEAKSAFQFPFDKKLVLLKNPKFGVAQLIENRIEEILIKLIRARAGEGKEIQFVMNSAEFENGLVNDVVALLKEHLYSSIDLDFIAQKTFYSKTYLNNIFKKIIGYSIIQYYNHLKIKEAKKLLREDVSVSAIADELGFESANYFTKVFKKFTKMTPSQYKKTTLE